MIKILLPFDGINFSEGAFEFVRSLNEMNPVLVVGVFLPELSYANTWSYADILAGSAAGEEKDVEIMEKNIRKFENLCIKNNIRYRLHTNMNDLAIPELNKETLFADLLIIGGEMFYKNFSWSETDEYLKKALRGAECPVLIVPEKFDFPETNILGYDGGVLSVYAIKQFYYLFPELCDQKTLLVYGAESDDTDLPDKDYIRELVSAHFNELASYKLEIDPKKYFATWISEQGPAILIAGAYGRSGFSEIFKKSFVADVIKDHAVPVFITHK